MAQTDLHFTFKTSGGDSDDPSEQLSFDVVEFNLVEELNQPFRLEVELISHDSAVDFGQVLDQGATLTIWQGSPRGSNTLSSALNGVLGDDLDESANKLASKIGGFIEDKVTGAAGKALGSAVGGLLSDKLGDELSSLGGNAAAKILGAGLTPIRHIHGIVSEFTQGKTGFRRTRYSAVIEPNLARTQLTSDWRIFQQSNVQEIIASVFKGNRISNFEINAQNSHAQREYCVQAGNTNFAFMQRLAAQEGFVYTFKHEESSHQLLMTDIVQTLGSIEEAGASILYNPNPAGDKPHPALYTFLYQERVRTATQTQRDYFFKNPRYAQEHESNGKSLSSQGEAHQSAHYERYDYPGQYKADEAGKPFTATRIQSLRNDAQIATVIGDDARIQPGFAFNLTGHPRSDMNIYWRPVKVIHSGKQYTAGEEEAATTDKSTFYEQTAILVPATADWKADLPAENKIHGSMMAHVTGPAGEEIYVDEFGRVKVQFPWDREGNNDEHSTCWIRVAQNWAGAGWGHMAIPRIGQEVIVSFLDGDESQPIITGRAYDANHPTPYKLPALKTQNTIKSKEHKGSGFNELLIDDTTGELKTQLHSTHAATQLTMGYLTHPRGSDGSGEYRGDGFELRTDDWGAIRAGKGLYLTADQREKAQGKQLDLSEAINQLQNALTLAQNLSTATQTAGADAVDAANQEEQLTETYENLQRAGILASAPAGIAATTPKSIQLSAEENLQFTAAQNIDSSTAKDYRVAAGESVSLFSIENGMKLIANKGKMQVQAQHNELELTAQDDLTISSTKGTTTIAAKEELILTCGGSYIKLKAGMIELGSTGVLEAKTAGFSLVGPNTIDFSMPSFSKVMIQDKYNRQFHFIDDDGVPYAHTQYTAYLPDGNEHIGTTDAQGHTQIFYSKNEDEISIHLNMDSIGLHLDQHNMRFKFVDDDNQPYAHTQYTATLLDGSETQGVTDEYGYSDVFYTDQPQNISIHLHIENL